MPSETVSDELLAEMQRDCGIANPPTQETYWFRKALAGEGPHAYDWSDKPHRLVFDLCHLIEADAALRSKPVAGVEVKPLEWSKTSYGRPEVETVVGVYRVFEHVDGGWAATFKTFNLVDAHGRKNFATEHEALAAAEADYRQRILSTLSIPAQEPVASVVAEIDVLLDNCHVVEDIDIAAQHEAVKALVRNLAATLLKQQAEIESLGNAGNSLQADLDHVSAAIGSVRWMDPPDGGNVPLGEQVNRMRVDLEAAENRLTEAVKVIQPFARYAWSLRGRRDDQLEVGWMGTNEAGESDEVNLTAGTFRAAQGFLTESKETANG